MTSHIAQVSKYFYHSFLFAIALLISGSLYAEGTKELKPDSTKFCELAIATGGSGYSCFATDACPPDQKLYVRIAHLSEKIYIGVGNSGGSITYSIKLNGTVVAGPYTVNQTSFSGWIKYFSQAYAGPNVLNVHGYYAIKYKPTEVGDYSIDFDNSSFYVSKIDVTVIDTAITPLAAIKGRLWSQDWAFNTSMISIPNNAFYATQYILSDDSIVTSLFYNGMRGHLFDVTSTPNGCFPPPALWDTSNRSLPGNHHYPQYKIFVNNPDSLVFPTGLLGQIVAGSTTVTPNCDGSMTITFVATKPGRANINIEVDPAPGQQPVDVYIIDTIGAGINTIIWNGLDGTGQPVPAGFTVGISMSYVNGLTNLALYDVERHLNGFIVQLVRPTGAALAMYWNDTLLANKGGTIQLSGCYSSLPPAGCHSWEGDYNGVGLGSYNTVNTWWYAASGSTDLGQYDVKREPPEPAGIDGLLTLCQSASATYTVNPNPVPGADPNGYEWVLTEESSGLPLFDLLNQGPQISIDFSLYPAGDLRLKVRGTTAECGNGSFGPGPGILIHTVASPSIINAVTTSVVCNGGSTDILLQSSDPASTFTYTAEATSASVTGYADGIINPIQQMLFNSGTEIDSVIYSVIPISTPCNGDTTKFYVQVMPVPTMTDPVTAYSICTGETTLVPLTGSLAACTFTWTATCPSPDVSGYFDSGGSTISQTLFNTGATTQTVTYNVTPHILSCDGTPSVYTVDVTPGNPVTVSIGASANPVCAGSQVTYTATPGNGGSSPVYQWKVNGVNAGTNSPSFNYIPVNNDIIICELTSNGVCTSGNPATSNTILMVIDSNLLVSVSISASANPVCEGTSVIYTATPVNGGAAPVFQWYVNGIPVGTNSPVFTYVPVNGDQVTCDLTSNATCATGNPATSNAILMVIDSNLLVSVSISASANPVCEGTSVNYTATPVNGGAAPVFQWYVNGIPVGTNSPVFAYVPGTEDQVTCDLTSSETVCVTNNPATSNSILMVIDSNLLVSVSISPSLNPVCEGAPVTFTATPVNGGTAPSYQWIVDGVNVGTNSPVYTYNPVSSDLVSCILTSNLTCTTGNPASSNPIVMNIMMNPVASFTACFDTITTVNAKPIKLKGGIPLGGIYSGAGVNTGIFYPAIAGPGTHVITYTYTNAGSCSDAAQLSIVNYPLSIINCGLPITDIRDNKVYPTIQIGTQCWMASNLNYGSQIPSSGDQRDNCIPEKYCYNDNPANCSAAGGPTANSYYQWDELMAYDATPGSQGLCPPEWHIPTEAEWNQLFSNFSGPGFAGSPLKYSGYSGFNAILSGTRHINKSWDWDGFATFFWSSDSPSQNKAWAHGMNDYDPSVSWYPAYRMNAFSVRCVKD